MAWHLRSQSTCIRFKKIPAKCSCRVSLRNLYLLYIIRCLNACATIVREFVQNELLLSENVHRLEQPYVLRANS